MYLHGKECFQYFEVNNKIIDVTIQKHNSINEA